MQPMPLPETVDRVARALARHTEMPFDETCDDMTVQFAMKLADADERIAKMRKALEWVAKHPGESPGKLRQVVGEALSAN